MKTLFTALALCLTLFGFAQGNTEKVPVISFDAIKDATTLQQLLPEAYGNESEHLTFTATVAVERQDPVVFNSSGQYLSGEMKKYIFKQQESGKKVLVYFDAVTSTEETPNKKLSGTVISIQ